MSEKDVILTNQKALTAIQLSQAEEIKDHLIKAESMLELISSSIEAKNADNKLDIASELNSLVAVFDQLEHASQDIDEIIAALQGVIDIDKKDE